MNSRLQALVDRGYSEEEVLSLAGFSDDELDYACRIAFERMSSGCEKTDNPTIVYIGGQPGSGKSIFSMEMKNAMPDYVEIGIDNYRMYHPRYLEIEKCIRNHWKGKNETVNDTPGNDIADFTHYFAGAMSDRLTDMASKKDENGRSYNILMEWGMREPYGPLKSMDSLKSMGYKNIVLFVAANSQVSYAACNLRADVMKNSNRIFRKVPKNFHDLAVSSLPGSIDVIYGEGYKKGIVDYMVIVSRNGQILWDINSKEKASNVYQSCLYENIEKSYNDLYKALQGNYREFDGLAGDKEKLKQIRDAIVVMDPYLYLSGKKSSL